MAKRDRPRHLRTVDPNETPAEPFVPSEAQAQFIERIIQAMAMGVDQFVTVCARHGHIVDFISLEDNRHNILGLLGEAHEMYDIYSSPVCICED